MIYLDTSTCVGILRGDITCNPIAMRAHSPKEFGIPVIVESELLLAAAQSDNPADNSHLVRQFLLPYPKVPYDSSCCELHCRIRMHLERVGTPCGTNILVLAAMAIRHDATLLTQSPELFYRIPGLKLVECSNDIEESLARC